MKTSYGQNIIFNNKRQHKINIKNIETKNILQEIDQIKKNKENVYIFESGYSAEFLYERSCVNDLSFNYLQMYNSSVYKTLENIKELSIDLCKELKVDMKKNLFYITSEYEENLEEDYYYDFGGTNLPSFCGYWFLQVDEDAHIKINNNEYKISNGDLLLFDSSLKILFSKIRKAISFNISTLRKIEGQYPQKWMPLILT